MDENHQDKTESNLIVTEDKLWLPLLSAKDQKRLARFEKKRMKFGFSGKTLWDWLPLLIQLLGALAIPVAIALGTIWFSYQQNQTSVQVARDQQQETTLKSYFDDMSDLLLNHNLGKSKPGDEVSQIARDRTLTTLRRLQANRNKIVLQFLNETNLIGTVFYLSDADLANDDLKGVNLSGSYLANDDLKGVILSGAELSGAYLVSANFSGADLSGADLNRADISVANFSGANLSGVQYLTQQQLDQVYTCKNAILPPELTCNRTP